MFGLHLVEAQFSRLFLKRHYDLNIVFQALFELV